MKRKYKLPKYQLGRGTRPVPQGYDPEKSHFREDYLPLISDMSSFEMDDTSRSILTEAMQQYAPLWSTHVNNTAAYSTEKDPVKRAALAKDIYNFEQDVMGVFEKDYGFAEANTALQTLRNMPTEEEVPITRDNSSMSSIMPDKRQLSTSSAGITGIPKGITNRPTMTSINPSYSVPKYKPNIQGSPIAQEDNDWHHNVDNIPFPESSSGNTPVTQDLKQPSSTNSYSFGFSPAIYGTLTGVNNYLKGLGSRKEESKYKQSLIDNGNSAIPFANNFSSGVKYGYQKGGRAPKIYTDRKQFEQAQRMYNDSLNLYLEYKDIYNRRNDSKEFEEKNKHLVKNNIKAYEKPFLDYSKEVDAFNKVKSKIKPISRVQLMPELYDDFSVNKYKKPVQPVVYQPQETITSPQTVSSQHGKKGMWGAEYDKKHPPIYVTNPKDPRIGQYGKDGNQYLYKGPTHPIQKMSRINPQQMDLNSQVNIQGQSIPMPAFQFPQQKGTPVYGPGNTIIGYSDNMNFKPAYEYTGASNNQLNLQDKALLADPEALKKYVLSKDNYKFQQGGGIFPTTSIDPGHEELMNDGSMVSVPLNRYETEDPNDPTYRTLNEDWQSGLQRTYNPLSQRSFDDKSKFMEENKPKFINDLRNRISNEDINSNSGFEIHNDVLTQAGYQGRRAWNTNDKRTYSDNVNRIQGNEDFYNPYLKYSLRNESYKNDKLLYKDSDNEVFTGFNQAQLDLPIPMLRQDKPKLGMNSMSTIPLGLNNEQSIITGIPTSMKPGNASLDFRERSNSQMNSMSTTPSILESFKARMKGLPTNMTSGNATLNLTDETPSPARQSMESMTTGNYPFNKDNNVSFNPQAQSYPNIKNSMTAINPTNYKPSSQQANITGTPVIPNTKPININLSETEDPIVRDNKTMSSINPSPYPFTKSGPSQMTGNMQEYPKQKMGMTAMSSAPYSSNNPANIKGVQTNMQIPTVQQPSYTTHPIEVYDKRGKFLRKEFIGNDKGIVDHKYIGRHHYAPRGGNSYIDTSYQMGGWSEEDDDDFLFGDDKRRIQEARKMYPYQDGGMTGMMKGQMAIQAHFGNPSAQRMIKPIINPYIFTGNEVNSDNTPFGSKGTHFMGSYGNQVRPSIQNVNGSLKYMSNPPFNSKENMNFNTEDEAEYFAKYYKNVAPMMRKFKKGGQLSNWEIIEY